jgi:hypothetical protein
VRRAADFGAADAIRVERSHVLQAFKGTAASAKEVMRYQKVYLLIVAELEVWNHPQFIKHPCKQSIYLAISILYTNPNTSGLEEIVQFWPLSKGTPFDRDPAQLDAPP